MKFPHRVNRDGTTDSICPRCFATIATSPCEAELQRMEEAHVCEPARLRYYEEERNKAGKQVRREEFLQEIESFKGLG